jgi:hypothetical protein
MKPRSTDARVVSSLPLIAGSCDEGSRVGSAPVGWAVVKVLRPNDMQLEVHLTGVEEFNTAFGMQIRFRHVSSRGVATWQTKWVGVMNTDSRGTGSCQAVTYVDDQAEGSVGCQVRIVPVAGACPHECGGGTKCYVSGPGLFPVSAK